MRIQLLVGVIDFAGAGCWLTTLGMLTSLPTGGSSSILNARGFPRHVRDRTGMRGLSV